MRAAELGLAVIGTSQSGAFVGVESLVEELQGAGGIEHAGAEARFDVAAMRLGTRHQQRLDGRRIERRRALACPRDQQPGGACDEGGGEAGAGRALVAVEGGGAYSFAR